MPAFAQPFTVRRGGCEHAARGICLRFSLLVAAERFCLVDMSLLRSGCSQSVIAICDTMTITMIEKTIEREVAFDAMGSFQVDERSGVPLWIQIRKRLVFLITSGKYERGERLPSVRELSVQLGVNYNTINKVYQDLERDGYIFTKRGRGTYVSDLKDVDLSAVGQDVEALAIDFVQQALAKGLTSEDIHDLVSEQILLLGGGA